MSADELQANRAAETIVVHDLNAEPRLPFEAASFDAVGVLRLRRLPHSAVGSVRRGGTGPSPAAPFVCTFSNRCFPTKAIRGWLYANDEERCDIVSPVLPLLRPALANHTSSGVRRPLTGVIRCWRSGPTAPRALGATSSPEP